MMSNETTQINLNQLSYWEDIWKLKFNIEKCKVLHIQFKNIQVEYKSSNRETKKINKECNLGDGFDRFKSDNHILSVVSRTNGMIGWMVRNSISRDADVLKMYKTLIRAHTQAWVQVMRYGKCSIIVRLGGGIQKRVTK